MAKYDLMYWLTCTGIVGSVYVAVSITKAAVKKLKLRRMMKSQPVDVLVELSAAEEPDLTAGVNRHQHLLPKPKDRTWADRDRFIDSTLERLRERIQREGLIHEDRHDPVEGTHLYWLGNNSADPADFPNPSTDEEAQLFVVSPVNVFMSTQAVWLPEGPKAEPPTAEEAASVAPNAEGSIDHALAKLFLQLGPPPEPTENDYAPASNGDGGAQQ
ncbi:hypothetical protein [Streptomyces sp. NRRL B-1381]|uniref:hypothetical protein n=1 Tax=Streptomyces sp. NRRL B-1381 TaxID=1463829 RepID=UPI0004C0AFE5|nr:hypothetical protein [Streptomyces sp. NRRL B-1381]